MKNTNRALIGILGFVSIATLLNMILIYWFPVIIPFSLYSTVQLMVRALIAEYYWLMILSVLICVLLFLTAVSIHRQHLLLPILSLTYMLYDLMLSFSNLIGDLGNGRWELHLIQTIVAAALVVLLSVYCITCFRNQKEEQDRLELEAMLEKADRLEQAKAELAANPNIHPVHWPSKSPKKGQGDGSSS